MRQFCVVLAALFGTAMPALAQVTVDLHALDALPGAKPAGKEHAVQHPALKSAQRRAATTTSAKPTPEPATEAPAATQKVATASPAPTAAPPATATPPPATLPTAPPPTVALAPVTTAPQVAQVGPPPPPPISDSAASAATSTGSGLRVTFGAGEARPQPGQRRGHQECRRIRPQRRQHQLQRGGVCRRHAGGSLHRTPSFAVARPGSAQRTGRRRRGLVSHLRSRTRSRRWRRSAGPS